MWILVLKGLSGVSEGTRVGGHLNKTVRFVDDQATLAS